VIETSSTKQKILDSAERLIAEQGYSATSLRQIIAAAGVNLAAIHYHFGSKEELLHELVMRKAGPVNEKRLDLLARYTLEAEGKPLPVEKVLDAFFIPMIETANANPQFVRVMGRIVVEGLLPSIVQKDFQPMFGRFVEAMRAALPELSPVELKWRFHFMTGVMAHTMCGAPEGNFEERIGRLVRFLAGGFRAPETEGK
jgi:AcrR family transcriptional regulator